MLNRRLLRVKVMQSVYCYHKNEMTLQQAEKNLLYNVNKSFELYHLLLLMLIEIREYAIKRMETGKSKNRPTQEELNPNTRFIDNLLLIKLSKNQNFLKYIDHNKLSWVNYPEIIKSLYNEICQSDLYIKNMDSEKGDFENDRKFIVKLIEKVIAQYEPLYENLEEQSIFWNDELEYVMSMVIKTLKELKNYEENNQELFPEYKDDSDKDFSVTLLRKTILNHLENLNVIKKILINWDLERIAFVDIILMEIALTEITEFESMPIKVSLNEYIEIAKNYSTPKSGAFINGVLEKIISNYMKEGKINKNTFALLAINPKKT
jgi:N utilization substance protein B